MSQAGSQAAAFYRDVARNRVVWAIRDAGGFPAPTTPEGKRSMPFWSSLSRALRIIKRVPAYRHLEPVEMSWKEFEQWLVELDSDGLLIGVNWSGPRARGYDVAPANVVRSVEALAKIGRRPRLKRG